MDDATDIIKVFRQEKPSELTHPDASVKPVLVRRLVGIVDDRVVPFFLEVLADSAEYDLARIEVLKALRTIDLPRGETRDQVGAAIRRALLHEPDDDIRDYAAIALGSFVDLDGSVEALEQVLANEDEDDRLRWNAFGAVEDGGPRPTSVELLKRLISDPTFEREAARVLDKWRVA